MLIFLVIVLSVIRITNSVYPFAVFKYFYQELIV